MIGCRYMSFCDLTIVTVTAIVTYRNCASGANNTPIDLELFGIAGTYSCSLAMASALLSHIKGKGNSASALLSHMTEHIKGKGNSSPKSRVMKCCMYISPIINLFVVQPFRSLSHAFQTLLHIAIRWSPRLEFQFLFQSYEM